MAVLPSRKKTGAAPLSPEQTVELAQEIASQMVRGWSLPTRYAFAKRLRAEYGIADTTFERLETAARKILTDSWDRVSRADLVARNLHRLELIAEEGLKYKQLSVVQAAVQTMHRTVGVDKPVEN